MENVNLMPFELGAELAPSEPQEVQTGFDFPQPLTEKYRPVKLAEFVGLDKPKRAMQKLVEKPYQSAWFFLGESGTGKTTMAMAIGAEMPAQIHHVASKDCTLETVKHIAYQCHMTARVSMNDWTPCKFHLVIIDEADQMSYPAQLAFLSLLDSTAFPPNTIFIFTGNSTDNLEARFMSRVRVLDFSSYGISGAVTDLLQKVWLQETSNPVETPNFQRIVKDSRNNVRASLMALETEIMCS